MDNYAVRKIIVCTLCHCSFIQCITTHYGRINEDIILTCTTPKRFTDYIWKKHTEVIAFGIQTTNKSPWMNRLRIIKTMNQYNLQILNVTKEDTGVYWCEMQDETMVIQRKVHLIVFVDATNEEKPDSKLETSSSAFHTDVTEDYKSKSNSSSSSKSKDKSEFFYITAATVPTAVAICLFIGLKVWRNKNREIITLAPRSDMLVTNNSEINNRRGSTTEVYSIHSYYEIDEANLQNIRTSIQHIQDERINTATTRSDATASYLEVVPGGSSGGSSSSLSGSQSGTVNSYQSISLPLTTNITNLKNHYQSLTNVEDQDSSSWCSKSCNVKKEKGDKNLVLNRIPSCAEGSVRRHSFP